MSKITKVGVFEIEDHSTTAPDGSINPLFIVKYKNTRQNYKTLEAAEKYCKEAGKVNRDVRGVDKKQEPKQPKVDV
jgi:hypothetical protein